MNSMAVTHNNMFLKETERSANPSGDKTLWTIALFLSGFTGISLAISGLAIAAASLLALIEPETHLPTISTVLIGLSMPLMIFTAHCMDKVDQAGKGIRLDYCRCHGLKDEDSEWV